jgi:hypothetical protein
VGYLPEFIVSGVDKPVFQVIDEKTKEILYTVRSHEKSFKPKVFSKGGRYTVIISEPDSGLEKRVKGVVESGKKLKVSLQ